MDSSAEESKEPNDMSAAVSYANKGYFQLLGEASKPIARRRELPGIGRGKTGVMRRYHLLQNELDQLGAAFRDGDVLPNPHNRASYFYILEALKKLGANRRHNFQRFFDTVKELMSDPETKQDGKTAWQRFRDKPQRSENGLDVEGRLLQNAQVLQRINPDSKNPYGAKINQVGQEVCGYTGACIDITRDSAKSPIMLTLNTEPTQFRTVKLRGGESVRLPIPVNQLVSRRRSVPEDEVVTVTAATARKRPAAKRKPKVVEAAPVVQSEPVAEAPADVETAVA